MSARRSTRREGSKTGLAVGVVAAVVALLVLGGLLFSGEREEVTPAPDTTDSSPVDVAPVDATKPEPVQDTPEAPPVQPAEPDEPEEPAPPPEPAASDRKSWPNDKSALGINLSGVIDWASEFAFVDVFLRCRPWISQQEGRDWGKGDPLELDAKGWVKRLKPGQRAEAFMITNQKHYPTGKYVCLYEGEGKISFFGPGSIVKSEPGRIEYDVPTPGDTFVLSVNETDPGNYVRNIRMIVPGHEETYREEPFRREFLDRYRKFKVIRFMDWMGTNNSEIREWADRPTPDYVSQGHKGVALEYMVDLSNRLHADPWFCMPHLASDDYVRKFAQQVRRGLDPGLRVYVEYSNEVWNGIFKQQRHAGDTGIKLGLRDKHWEAGWLYYSQRSVEMFRIWEEVFGGTDRLVRILGSQSVNAFITGQIISHNDAWRHADAVAIAPYFGNDFGHPTRADAAAKMSLAELFAGCREDIAKKAQFTRQTVEVAAAKGLDVIAYEGGQHLVGFNGAENNQSLMALFHAAQRDPGMKDLYLEDLATWKAAGGKTFAVFSSVTGLSKWGSWGILEYEGQPPAEAPKYQAVMEFIEKNPRWWADP